MTIPHALVVFAGQVCKLAKEAGLSSFQGTFRPGFDSKFREEITMSWSEGRHGCNTGKIRLTYNQVIGLDITNHKEELEHG